MSTTVAKEYGERVREHIRAVQQYGDKLNINPQQLAAHDLSKWSAEEFMPYALRFCSSLPQEETADKFARAWLHHIHHNPHHWQHWMFPDGYTITGGKLENGVARMPDKYAMEMIADWHGAGFAYTGSWDIMEWLSKNMKKITVHTETADFLRGQLDMLGYADVVYMQPWAHEK